MKKSKLIMAGAMVMAITSAFAFRPLTNGFTGSSVISCPPANVDTNCSTSGTRAVCTDLHYLSDCSDLLRKINP